MSDVSQGLRTWSSNTYFPPICKDATEEIIDAQPARQRTAIPRKPLHGPARCGIGQERRAQSKPVKVPIKDTATSESKSPKGAGRIRRQWINFLEDHDLTASEYKFQLGVQKAREKAGSFIACQTERITNNTVPKLRSTSNQAQSILKRRTHQAHGRLQQAWSKAKSLYYEYTPRKHRSPDLHHEPTITSPPAIILPTTQRPKIEPNPLVEHIVQQHSPQALQSAMFLHQYRQVLLSTRPPPWSEALRLVIMVEERSGVRPEALKMFHGLVRDLARGWVALVEFLGEVMELFADQRDLCVETGKFWERCLSREVGGWKKGRWMAPAGVGL